MSDIRRFVKYLVAAVCFLLIYWYISCSISNRQEQKQQQMNDAIKKMQEHRGY